jgi:hypothetical protein
MFYWEVELKTLDLLTNRGDHTKPERGHGEAERSGLPNHAARRGLRDTGVSPNGASEPGCPWYDCRLTDLHRRRRSSWHAGSPGKAAQHSIADKTVGVTGAARRLPADASWFQRRVALEIPRMVNPVPEDYLETNPALKGYGHSLITTTCCALRRQVYDRAGSFRSDLISGVDTDFFYRVRRLGYRFLMVPHTYVEHPLPDSFAALVHKFLWYGQGYSQEALLRPEQRIGPRLQCTWQRSMFILAASIWLLPNIFVLYSLSYPRWEVGFRPLKALSTYAVAWGYVKGWSRYSRNGNT